MATPVCIKYKECVRRNKDCPVCEDMKTTTGKGYEVEVIYCEHKRLPNG